MDDSLNPLLAIALIFIASYPAGLLARRIGIPAVTGNILAGVLLGPSVLGIFQRTVAQDLELVSVFAMGLVTAIIGGHLSYRRLHNAKRRILSVTLVEMGMTALLVTSGTFLIARDLKIALLLGAIAVSTAPATVLAVVREERAKGLLVKTVLASVALDNVFCIVMFAMALALVGDASILGTGFLAGGLWLPLFNLFLSVLMGSAVGALLIFLVRRHQIEPFTGLLLAVLLTSGGAQFLGISPLLSSLCMGIVVGNSGRETEKLISSLESLEPILFTCFFTLAGVNLELHTLATVGFLGAIYFGARAVGKIGGGFLGGRLGTDVSRVRNNVGLALLPQAGLAIGLVVLLQGDPRFPQELISTITNVVLAAVVINEILGPPLVHRSVKRAGEAGKDRPRLVEFFHEEYILIPLDAEDQWDAIRQLAGFLIRSHGLKDISVDQLVESAEEREREFSTAIGNEVALPHAHITAGPEIMGVMGISHRGLDFGAPDGSQVHFVILIVTPKEHLEKHLEVMSTVARIMSHPEIRTQLFIAANAAEAAEAVEADLVHDYNYFLED